MPLMLVGVVFLKKLISKVSKIHCALYVCMNIYLSVYLDIDKQVSRYRYIPKFLVKVTTKL